MSKYLTTNAVQEFDAEVKHQYQSIGGVLRDCVTMRTGVVGDSYKFARMGRGMAGQKATQADVTPMDVTHVRQTATLENWYAAEYTDIFDQAEVNYDEKTELAKVIAWAMKRREEQIILDTLNSATTYASTNDDNPETALEYDPSGSGTKFVMSVVHRATQHFQELEIMDDELHFAVTPTMMQALLQEANTPATSIDYNSIKPLLEGKLTAKWMNFNWHLIGTRAEGGMPATDDTDLYGFAWAKSAVGMAVGIDMKTEINYIAQKTSWLCNGLYKAGAVLREPQGIVRVRVAP